MQIKGKHLSDQLRSAIESSKLSLYVIAKGCHIDEGNLNKFVHLKGGLRLATIDRLCEFLQLRLSKS